MRLPAIRPPLPKAARSLRFDSPDQSPSPGSQAQSPRPGAVVLSPGYGVSTPSPQRAPPVPMQYLIPQRTPVPLQLHMPVSAVAPAPSEEQVPVPVVVTDPSEEQVPVPVPIEMIESPEVSPRAEDYQPSAPPLHALPHPTAQECLRHLDSLAAIPHYIYIHNQPSAPPLQDLPHPTAQECLRRLDALELEIAWMRELMSRLH